MRKLLYICIALFSILIVSSCGSKNHNKMLAQTDSLLSSRPDSALKLLDSIEKYSELSQAELMHLAWNRALAHRRMGLSMTEDTLLPRAAAYYRQNSDSSKLYDGYLLEGRYWRWNNQDSCALAVLDSGLQCAFASRDTSQIITFYREKAEIYHRANKHTEAIDLVNTILQYSNKLSARDQATMLYALALNLSLIGDPASYEHYERSIDMAMAAGDTAFACEYMRNYADCLAGNSKYAKSNELVQRILQLMPVYNDYSVLRITLAGNFIQLRQLDSARYYWNMAWAIEQKWQAKGYKDFAHRAALAQMKSILDYTGGAPLAHIDLCRFGDSIMNEMRDQQKTIVQQLETKNKLQEKNYELVINRQKQRLHLMIVSVLLVIAVVGLYLYIRNRKRHLAEAEERIDVLTRLLNDAQKASNDSLQEDGDAFFKKMLLQQLGIIRMVANTPTSQNQALLKLISGISNNEIPVEGLLVWVDLYPIIDKLYDDFYTRLVEKYRTALSDKEIQICCLLCANFSTKEIGVVTQQTSATIYVRKSSIRKKLGMGEKQDIVDFINAI